MCRGTLGGLTDLFFVSLFPDEEDTGRTVEQCQAMTRMLDFAHLQVGGEEKARKSWVGFDGLFWQGGFGGAADIARVHQV
jgi:hypothetical protein